MARRQTRRHLNDPNNIKLLPPTHAVPAGERTVTGRLDMRGDSHLVPGVLLTKADDASRSVMQKARQNARRAALPASTSSRNPYRFGFSGVVTPVSDRTGLLPVRDSCRVLRAGGRVKGRSEEHT